MAEEVNFGLHSRLIVLCVIIASGSVFGTVHGSSRDLSGDHNEAKSYKGHSLVRILPEEEDHLDFLQKLQQKYEDKVEFWRHPVNVQQHVDMRLSPDVTKGILPYLNQSGLTYNIMANDLQELMEAERSKRSLPDIEADPDITPSNFSLSEYHPYDEILRWLEEMELKCGEVCELIDIGDTYEGRPMKVLRIGEESDKRPGVFIDAGLHAREWIAPATALYIMSRLVNGQVVTSDRVARYLVNKYTWYILPVSNPDGYSYTWTADRLWRKTRSHHNRDNECRGVDPNRNWGFEWGGPGTSGNPCSDNYRGQTPFSEPETQNMARFLLTLEDKLAIYLTLHSYGQLWLTPWGYTMSVPDDYRDMLSQGFRATDAIRRNHGTQYQVGSSARLLYLAAGGSDDWVKAVLGVKYAYTVELRDTGRHGFILPPDLIQSTGREMMNGIRTLAVGVLRERRRAARRRRRS